jgi:DNA polymerase III subunit epsilon
MRQIVLDTETTGLSAEGGDRVIEIGCVELLHRKLTGNNLHFYLNPERDSHEEALKVHGISNEFLRDKPKFKAIANELMNYLQGAEVIIHNAPFDVGFLNKELELIGKPAFKQWVASVTDTLTMAKEMFPGKRNSLDALCDRLEVDNLARRAARRRIAGRRVHQPHTRPRRLADGRRRQPEHRCHCPQNRLERHHLTRHSGQRFRARRPR